MNPQQLTAKYGPPTAGLNTAAAPKPNGALATFFASSSSKPAATAQPQSETGGFSEVGSDLKNDANSYAQEINQTNSSNENVPSKALQDVGSGAKLIGNAAVDLVKPAIKPQIKQDVKSAVGAVAQTPEAQALAKAWGDFAQAHPEAANNIKATGNIASILVTPEAGGAAGKAVQEGVEQGTKAAADSLSEVGSKVASGAQGVKDAAQSGKDAVANAGKKPFQDVYNAHAQSSKPLSNALKANTIVKDGKTVTPIDTMETYDASPKVASNTKGGHVLDMSDVQAEAAEKSKAASKTVDAKVAAITQDIPKKPVLESALDAASKDKDVTRTASVPGVQHNIKQIFQDYGIEGGKITPNQVNEFRKGANTASQAYYSAQKVAATAGAIPKDVADRAQAFAILGDTFRKTLTDIDPSIDSDLTTQRLHNAVQQYAAKANRSTIGLTGAARTMTDVGAGGVGAALGSVLGPAGAAVGAGAGAALSEKAQTAILRKTYEGAIKAAR